MVSTTTSADGFDRTLAVQVARRFYLEDRSKVEIASELGISRFKVARLLDAAREHGVVTITIADDGEIDADRSMRLAAALGLERCTVVSSSDTEDDVRHTVGRAAARVLSTTLVDGEVLGMGWGRTLSATAEAIERLPHVTVVQLTGATEMARNLSPVEIVRRLGHHAGGPVVPIFAPIVADDAATAQAFRRQSDIARALAMHDDVTTAFMSIGGATPGSSQLLDVLDADVRDDLLARGVVAEMGVTLVAADGAVIAPDFAERCIAVTAEQMRAIPRLVGVAAGAAKAVAAVAVVRGDLVNELVVDVALADEAMRIVDAA